jgi:putative sigma-54 modulation protein
MNTDNQSNLEIVAHHCDIDDKLRLHVAEKLRNIERLWPRIDDALVRFTEQRGLFSAEITLISGGLITRGEERGGNSRQAFDAAQDKVERQLRRYKDKVVSLKRRHDNRDDEAGAVLNPSGVAPSRVDSDMAGAMAAAASPATSAGALPGTASAVAERAADDDNSAGERLVRVKRFALKPMTPDEAALQMDLLGHSFFVFRDAASNEVRVVYRRRDGDFGMIEPVPD